MASLRSAPSASDFAAAYQRALREVYGFWTPEMQGEIARHCCGWSVGCFDFAAYLAASKRRYLLCWSTLASQPGLGRICDVGGFWGVFPLTLRALGYEVAMTESLRFYSACFDPLFSFIRERGVEILDYDPFEQPPPIGRPFDAVTAMAVIEHYPHSLKRFLDNVLALLRPEGALYVEVPNLAYWPKRLAMLRGRTPLVPATDIYRSAVPFIGHHHEYTLEELRGLAGLAGLQIQREHCYSYSPRPGSLGTLLRPVQSLVELLLPDSRECLAILATRGPQRPGM